MATAFFIGNHSFKADDAHLPVRARGNVRSRRLRQDRRPAPRPPRSRSPRLRVLHVEQAVAAFMCIYPPSGPATVSTAASHPDPAAIQRRASRANAGASQRKPVRKTVAGSVTAPQR